MATRSSKTGRAWHVLFAITALACAGVAAAETDHLTGYKVKEAVTPYLSSHALQDALGSGNCTLKKAKFYLTGAEKDAGDDPRGGPAGDYICYTAKCDLPEPVLPLKDDQLGSHVLEAKKVKIVCLPVNPCPAGATLVGGSCWFLGNDGESCDTVCTNQGLAYDSATETYAGSGGTDENCQEVWNALAGPGGFTTLVSCSLGNGCSGFAVDIPPSPPFDVFTRCDTPPTTGASSSAAVKRACACQ